MKSGLDGRNNEEPVTLTVTNIDLVSMKSGLDGRNNGMGRSCLPSGMMRLNEVRPRWPEQWLASEGRLD